MIRCLSAALALSIALPACAQTSVPQTAVAPPEPRPQAEGPPYSSVIVSGDTIYLAGHLGFVPGTRDYPEGGISAQTTQTMENIGATLATVGAGHADLVRCQVFLADIADFSEMNAAYRTFFPDTPPARTTVAVSGLAADALIEIECTGRVGHGNR
ncbi:MAG: RidA family protein [Pseudomonadota bacterium]